MAARHDGQVRRATDAGAIQKSHSPRHQRVDHHAHQRKLQRQRSHDSGGWESGPINSSSPSTIADYISGGSGARVTRTAGITGLLTVSEHARVQNPHPPVSPATSASTGSQRAHQRQSPAAAATVSSSPRVSHSHHKQHRRDHMKIKASTSAPTTSTEDIKGILTLLRTYVRTNRFQSLFIIY